MGKKQDLLKAAVQLFSKQGFDGTAILEITEAAHVTEPIIYYHFKNKDGLFTHILVSTFAEYFDRLDKLENNTPTQFEKIENLIQELKAKGGMAEVERTINEMVDQYV